MYILDFNPARISGTLVYKRWDVDSEEGDEVNVICASRVARLWFPRTTLPYRETVLTSLSGEPLIGIHMDENGLALVRPKLDERQVRF